MKVEAFGSLLRHAQRGSIVIVRLQVRKALDYKDVSRTMSRNVGSEMSR